jgi:hypothetical protein
MLDSSISSSSNLPSSADIVQSSTPQLTYDWDVSKCSIELLMTLVLVNTGMGPLENSMKDVVKDQNIQNKVDADMIQLSELISEIESASKANGVDSGTVKNLQGQLQAVLKNLFGADATTQTVNGQTYILPDPNSDLGKFIAMLQEKNGGKPDPSGIVHHPYDYHTDPVFDLLSQVGTYLMGNSVTGSWQTDSGSNSWQENYPCPDNMWQTIMNGSSSDFQNMIDAMAGNHWLTENPGTKDGSGNSVSGGTDYLATMYNQASGAQSGLQGLGSQNTSLLQTDSSSENSLDQTGQNILNAANSLKLYMLQHGISS